MTLPERLLQDNKLASGQLCLGSKRGRNAMVGDVKSQ